MEIIEINVLGPWQFYNVDGRYYSAKQYHNLLKEEILKEYANTRDKSKKH